MVPNGRKGAKAVQLTASMEGYVEGPDEFERCPHPRGLRGSLTGEFRCPVCGARLDVGAVEGWVRRAEVERDAAYARREAEPELSRALFGDHQREVYRRRRVMYEMGGVPRAARVESKPEMVLVSYDVAEDSYECRIFYKETGSERGLENFTVAARTREILEYLSHSDPNVRLAAGKLEEFRSWREYRISTGEVASVRRVFYSNEL